MSTLNQLRSGLSRAWETVSEGWRELVDRAGDALTRFNPKHSSGDIETREERIAQRGARWGVLAAEVQVDEDAVNVDLEIPGMDADDFEIDVHDDVLIVRGEKKVERERREGHFHVMERAYGSFERALRLPVEVNGDGTRARYDRGVLHITLPRSEAHKPRRISVQRG